MLGRPVLLLTSSVAIIGSNSLLLSPIAGTVAASFERVEPADVMIASATYGLGTAVSALTLAPLVDRIGAKKALLIAMSVLIAGLVPSASAPALWILCVSQGISGLAAGAALPAVYTLSAQIAPKGRESETLGIVLTGWMVSMVLGVSLSAALADFLHWRAVFLALAAFALLLVLLLWLKFLPVPPRAAVGVTSPMTALRVQGIWNALGVCAAYMIAFYGLYTYLGPYVQDELGRSTSAAGLLPLAYGMGFGAAVPFDRLIDRHGAARVAAPVFVVLAIVYAAMAIGSSSYTGLIGLALLWGLANHLALNLIVIRLTGLDSGQRGAIMGLYSAVTYLSVTAGALAYRPVFALFDLQGCALLSMFCIAFPIVDAVRGRSHTRRQSTEQMVANKPQLHAHEPGP